MEVTGRDYAITGAVFIGAMILFGPATYWLFVGAVTILADAVGLAGTITGVVGTAIRILAVLAAVEVVTEITAVQLRGMAALHRGSRTRRLVRHLLLSAAVLAATVVVAFFLVDVARWSLDTGRRSYLATTGLVALALAWVVVRAVSAFREGYVDFGRER